MARGIGVEDEFWKLVCYRADVDFEILEPIPVIEDGNLSKAEVLEVAVNGKRLAGWSHGVGSFDILTVDRPDLIEEF